MRFRSKRRVKKLLVGVSGIQDVKIDFTQELFMLYNEIFYKMFL